MLKLSTLERFYILISLLLLSGAFLPLWRKMSGLDINFIEGDPLQQTIFATIYTISFFFLLLQPRRTLETLRAGIYLWPLVGWAFLSVLWSEVPEVTIRRVIALLGTTIFGVYLSSRFEQREFLRLLGRTLLVMVLLSYIIIFLMPDWGIMVETRWAAWRGIYVHKNSLGRIAVLAVVVFLLMGKSEPRRRYLWWIFLVLAIGLLIGSRSATAIVVLGILILILPIIKILRFRSDFTIPLLSVIVVVGGIVSWFMCVNLETLLGILGRDVTLTGRTILWEAVVYATSQRLWLGYGYGAFWLGWDGPSALIWQNISFQPSDAHNSFLDIWLSLGIIGVGLFVLSYFKVLERGLNLFKKTGESLTLWPIIYLLFVLLYSVSESSILRQNNIWWVLYVVVVLKVRGRNFGINPMTKRKKYNDMPLCADVS